MDSTSPGYSKSIKILYMKPLITTTLLSCFFMTILSGQGKYFTSNGTISFYSYTPIEEIAAENNTVSGVIDAATGEMAIIVEMTAFQFKKKLMQEHFNENYVESHIFPKARFNGRITNHETVDYSSTGSYEVEAKGEMTLHGVTRVITTEGTLEVQTGGLAVMAVFSLNPKDYEIRIPRVVRKNIAEQLEVTVNMNLIPV